MCINFKQIPVQTGPLGFHFCLGAALFHLTLKVIDECGTLNKEQFLTIFHLNCGCDNVKLQQYFFHTNNCGKLHLIPFIREMLYDSVRHMHPYGSIPRCRLFGCPSL